MFQAGGNEEVDDEEEEIEAPQYPGYCSLFRPEFFYQLINRNFFQI